MSVLGCYTCWVESQEPQNRFYEPVVGGYRHGRRLVAKARVYLTLPLSGRLKACGVEAESLRWPVHSRGWLDGPLRSRKQLLEFIFGLLSITQDFGKQPRTQRFTRMSWDYSSSAIGMSQKMMTSLYSQNLKANLSKCQNERLARDSGIC